MIYRFGEFELDAAKVELRKTGAGVEIEPQVFALILLLAENRERMVSKDEIIEKIWDGRIVSEAAVASRVKSARKALGDDGKAQKFIRTIHGQGFRFVAETSAHGAAVVKERAPEGPTETDVKTHTAEGAKPSIAVLPFRLVGVAGPYAGIADALPHELITEMSRLRWLFVIARGSSFRFRAAEADIEDVGRALNVRYCLSGVVEVFGDHIGITVELADTRDGSVLWGERFAGGIDGIHHIREQIVTSIISALEIQIPFHEAKAARLASPDHLDAWSAYHLGLAHLHRFNKKDNEIATAMFERAIGREPDFARAHAGLSSTHFQNAFLRYNQDRSADKIIARRSAERSIELDPLDPFANFAMGRVHWVEDDIAGGVGWLDRANSLCPNYAQGVYARAWADTVSGQGETSKENIDLALSLSPLDPFRYAMLGVRAFTYLMRGEDKEGAYWADQAARAPGAHVLIAMIALVGHVINGDSNKAQFWAENVRSRKSDITQADFFQAFPFEDATIRTRITKAFGEFGF